MRLKGYINSQKEQLATANRYQDSQIIDEINDELSGSQFYKKNNRSKASDTSRTFNMTKGYLSQANMKTHKEDLSYSTKENKSHLSRNKSQEQLPGKKRVKTTSKELQKSPTQKPSKALSKSKGGVKSQENSEKPKNPKKPHASKENRGEEIETHKPTKKDKLEKESKVLEAKNSKDTSKKVHQVKDKEHQQNDKHSTKTGKSSKDDQQNLREDQGNNIVAEVEQEQRREEDFSEKNQELKNQLQEVPDKQAPNSPEKNKEIDKLAKKEKSKEILTPQDSPKHKDAELLFNDDEEIVVKDEKNKNSKIQKNISNDDSQSHHSDDLFSEKEPSVAMLKESRSRDDNVTDQVQNEQAEDDLFNDFLEESKAHSGDDHNQPILDSESNHNQEAPSEDDPFRKEGEGEGSFQEHSEGHEEEEMREFVFKVGQRSQQ